MAQRRGQILVAARNTRACGEVRGRRAHQSRATQRTTLIRAALMDRRVRAPARSPVFWSPWGGGRGSKRNSVGGRTRGAGQTRLTTLRLDARHHRTKHFTDRTPLGTRSRTGLEIGNSKTRGHDCTSFPDSTLRDERGTKPTRRRLRQKTGTLTQRYWTQLHWRRHLQGGEPRRNTGEQLVTCDSPCLEERVSDDALRGDRPTWGGGLWLDATQLRRKLGRNTTRRD